MHLLLAHVMPPGIIFSTLIELIPVILSLKEFAKLTFQNVLIPCLQHLLSLCNFLIKVLDNILNIEPEPLFSFFVPLCDERCLALSLLFRQLRFQLLFEHLCVNPSFAFADE